MSNYCLDHVTLSYAKTALNIRVFSSDTLESPVEKKEDSTQESQLSSPFHCNYLEFQRTLTCSDDTKEESLPSPFEEADLLKQEVKFDDSESEPNKFLSDSKKIKKTKEDSPLPPQKAPRKKKAFWSPEEDAQLQFLLTQMGPKWTQIGRIIGDRSGKQVRDRYMHKLKPNINFEEWIEQEDALIISLYQELGSKWLEIAKHLSNRTESQVKNRFYCKLKQVIAESAIPREPLTLVDQGLLLPFFDESPNMEEDYKVEDVQEKHSPIKWEQKKEGMFKKEEIN